MANSNIRTQVSKIRPELLSFVTDLLANTSNKYLAKKYQSSFNQFRSLFIIGFLYDTGLQISEIIKCKMNDIKYEETKECWYLEVIDNSKVLRKVYLHENTLELIKLYRNEIGLGFTLPSKFDSTPIIHKIRGSSSGLKSSEVSRLIKVSFSYVQIIITSYLENKNLSNGVRYIIEKDLETLKNATAKWLRYSHAYSFLIMQGNSEIATMNRLGVRNICSSIVSTIIFSSNENYPMKNVEKTSEIYDNILSSGTQ